MRHATEIHGMLQIADARAYGDDARISVSGRVEYFRRIGKIDAQLERRPARACKIFMHQIRRADVVALAAILPIAEDMVARMPKLVLVGAVEPRKPPCTMLARHPGMRVKGATNRLPSARSLYPDSNGR
jgi:hypothetical protein